MCRDYDNKEMNMERTEFLERAERISKRALEFCKKARREGLFALESEIDTAKKNGRDIFEYGMQFVVGGTDLQIIRTILSDLIAREPDGYARRLKEMQKEIVLGIAKGYNPGVLLVNIVPVFIDGPFDSGFLQKAFPKYEVFENHSPKWVGAFGGEKQALFAEDAMLTVSKAVRFGEKARREGILALDEDIESVDDQFMKCGLRLLVDGSDYKGIDEILSLRISVEPDGYARRLRTIQKEAVLSIHAGEDTTTLLHVLMSHISNDELEALWGKRLDAKPRDDFSAHILSMFAWPPAKYAQNFSREMPGLVKKALDFRHISREYGFWVLENLLDRRKRMERDIFEYGVYLSAHNIGVKTIKKILSNLVALEGDGETRKIKSMQKDAMLHIWFYDKLLHILMSHLDEGELEALRKTHPEILAGASFFENPPCADTEPKATDFVERLAHVVDRAYMFWQKAKGEGLWAVLQLIDESKVECRDIFEYGIWLCQARKWAYDSYGDMVLSNLIFGGQDAEERRLKTIQKEFVRSIVYEGGIADFLYPLMSHASGPELEALGKISRMFSDTDDACFYLPVGFEPLDLEHKGFVHGVSSIVRRAIESEKAQGEGIVTVDDQKRSRRDVFECGLHLASCGMASEKIERILTNMIALGRDGESKRLKEIQKKAALCIRQGLHPIEFVHVLLSGLDDGELAALLESAKDIADIFHYDGTGNPDTERERNEGKTLVPKTLKGERFTFPDILALGDRDIQAVLRGVDSQKLATALEGADGDIRKRIFANMPARAVAMLNGRTESPTEEVEKARREIVDIIRKLESEGLIVIRRGTD